jgi:hypothetical protein
MNRISAKIIIILWLVTFFPFISCTGSKSVNELKKDEVISDYVAVTTTANLNMRIQPHHETARIMLLSEGLVLDVLEKNEEPIKVGKSKEYWYHLRTEQGNTGWVYGNYLVLVKKEKRDRAIEIASKRIQEEKLKIIKKLSGFWIEIYDDGLEGDHRLGIFDDSSYLSFQTNRKELYLGELEVSMQKQRLEFKSGASLGRSVNYYHDVHHVYNLSLTRYGRNSKFERSTAAPPKQADLAKKGYKVIR